MGTGTLNRLQALASLFLRFVDVKPAVQFGFTENSFQFLVQAGKGQPAAFLVNAAAEIDQNTQSETVDILGLLEIHHNLLVVIGFQMTEQILESLSVLKVDLAFNLGDCNITYFMSGDGHVALP